jgi:hypothetical protein
MWIRRLLLATVACCAFGAAPAAADTRCERAADATLAVHTVMAFDVAEIVRSGDAIAVRQHGVPVTCTGTASTVTNTERIFIDDVVDGPNEVTIDLSGGPFAPGVIDELGATDEIEFEATTSSSREPTAATTRSRAGPAPMPSSTGPREGRGWICV